MQGPPLGIVFFRNYIGRRFTTTSKQREFGYRTFVLFFTFICYVCFHMSRKPLSVVKTVLHQNCSTLSQPNVHSSNSTNWCDWKPFDQENADELLGLLDSAFLVSYAASMFISGQVAERVDLRFFLGVGMVLSGVFTYMFGLAFSRNIHWFWYFFIIQVFGGIVQSAGWPSVVTCVGNWFGRGRRGLIFGVWNSHTSIGNILGSLIAGSFLSYNWGYSFIVPGTIIIIVGLLVLLFLVVHPEEVDCSPPDHHGDRSLYPGLNSSHYRTVQGQNLVHPVILHGHSILQPKEEVQPLLGNSSISVESGFSVEEPTPITFRGALSIPGVVEFALSLFFAKLVSYTFLYWLPKYIKVSTSFSPTESANLSTLFDVGGILGGIIAGVLSDYSGAPAVTCSSMLVAAVPMMFAYEEYGNISLSFNIMLLMLCGMLVNGPYALITTAVSAELGTHSSLRGNAKALATVTAIIDGTGSLGAAIGPLLAGYIASSGWSNVFYMLMFSDVAAVLFLSLQVKREGRRLLLLWMDRRHHQYA